MKLLWEQDMVKVTRLDALENGAGGMRTYAIFLTLREWDQPLRRVGGDW